MAGESNTETILDRAAYDYAMFGMGASDTNVDAYKAGAKWALDRFKKYLDEHQGMVIATKKPKVKPTTLEIHSVGELQGWLSKFPASATLIMIPPDPGDAVQKIQAYDWKRENGGITLNRADYCKIQTRINGYMTMDEMMKQQEEREKINEQISE